MNLSQKLSLLTVSVLALGLVGCATKPPEVNTEFDSFADFTGVKTYTMLPLPKEIPGADPGLAIRVSGDVVTTVRAAMTAKGYTEAADKASADIAVLVHGKLAPKTDITDGGFAPTYGAYGWNRGYRGDYGGMFTGGNVTVDQYDEGTLIAEVYDVESKRMIWVGWITGRANTNREGQNEHISAGVDRVLGYYPPMGAMPVSDNMAQ